MPALRSRVELSLEERAARHRLVVRDAISLSSLFTIILALTFVTYALFHSFAGHRLLLEQRWRTRGEEALRQGHPQAAIQSLRSALAYAPDERGLQVELATALAAAGRTQEATVYFNTLHEQQPGDGSINVQLARLAIRQGNAPLAIQGYQAALDGTWNGDGFLRRREVRLELSRFLIAQHRFDEARSQLLIAAGNAADNHGLQLLVAGMLVEADGHSDAFDLYRKAMTFRDTRTAGLIGAGRVAAAQSRYLVARNLLDEATTQPDYLKLPQDERNSVHAQIDEANNILVLYPSQNLPPHARAIRVAHDAQVAHTRLAACPIQPLAAATSTRAATPAPTPLSSAIVAVERAGQTLARTPAAPAPTAPAPPAAIQTPAGLLARWQQLPAPATLLRQMERDPALLQTTLTLVYDTEKATAAQTCGPPTGEDLLLLRIAAAPDQIDQP